MRRGAFLVLIAIQLAVFVGTLGLGIVGTLSGEAAGCAALVAWFVVGLPASYAAADAANAHLVRRDATRRKALTPVQAPSSAA